MSTILSFAAAKKQSRAETLAGWLAGGTLTLYSASRPATADTAVTDQTLLVTLTLPDPLTVTNGVISANLATAYASAEGTAAWGRFRDSSAGTVCDADVGLENTANAITLDNLSIVTGAALIDTAFSLSET